MYQQYPAQSDAFIELYWQLVPGAQVSGLEEEFELSGALPRLLYVKTPAPGREPRLADLLDRIQAEASRHAAISAHPPSRARTSSQKPALSSTISGAKA